MTREETKKHFKSWCQAYIGNTASNEDYHMFNNIMALLEQEPCEDAVSRAEVLNLVRFNAFHVKSQIKAIENMPSVTPQEPKWIPVTERLPEEGQFVIVSYPYDASDYSRKRVMTAWYHKEYGFTCGIADAWMPLPEPYRTGREE